MKRKNIFAIISIALCAVFCSVSCSNSNKPVDAAQDVEEANGVVTIDDLLSLMANDLSGEKSLDGLAKDFEAQSAAIKSYWQQNHQNEDETNMVQTVLGELKSLADSLSGGSTADMVQSGDITCAMYRYETAKEYCSKYSDNALYQEEMRDWLQLEKGLNDFYSNLAQVAYWQGSIVNVIISNTRGNVANLRQQDYSQLFKGGKVAECPMPIAEARTNLIQEINDARNVENPDAGEEFEKTLNALNESGDQVVALLDKWLASRNKLCESLGISESHTAALIDSFSRKIMEIIEN